MEERSSISWKVSIFSAYYQQQFGQVVALNTIYRSCMPVLDISLDDGWSSGLNGSQSLKTGLFQSLMFAII